MSLARHSSSYEALTVPERIEMLRRLWDELAASPEELGLTDAQRAELDCRLEDYRRDPDAGVSWESLRNSLHGLP